MDIIKCWAYNGDALRCMQPAGHDGPHAHAIEWTDEECWAPETFERQTPQPASNEALVEHLVEVLKSSGKCVICSHRFHESVCSAPDGDGFDCDCAAGVEE